MGHWFKHDKLEDRLRAERPRPSDDLISSIKGELAEAKPRTRRGSRPQLRLAGITAALVLGVLAVGGAGFAMTYGADFATRVIHHTFVSHRTVRQHGCRERSERPVRDDHDRHDDSDDHAGGDHDQCHDHEQRRRQEHRGQEQLAGLDHRRSADERRPSRPR